MNGPPFLPLLPYLHLIFGGDEGPLPGNDGKLVLVFSPSVAVLPDHSLPQQEFQVFPYSSGTPLAVTSDPGLT